MTYQSKRAAPTSPRHFVRLLNGAKVVECYSGWAVMRPCSHGWQQLSEFRPTRAECESDFARLREEWEVKAK